jgi:hypothetical protein
MRPRPCPWSLHQARRTAALAAGGCEERPRRRHMAGGQSPVLQGGYHVQQACRDVDSG